VAAACAAAGADCLDISGEPEFMERVEAELHEPAARTGSLIVSACGFDSVPAELGFLFHSRQWEPPSALVSVEAYLYLQSTKRIVGNIGTYESAVLGVANAGQLQALRRSRPRRPRPNVSSYALFAASASELISSACSITCFSLLTRQTKRIECCTRTIFTSA
jgi:short subunit dehydrogenase-like uncharacterized protein